MTTKGLFINTILLSGFLGVESCANTGQSRMDKKESNLSVYEPTLFSSYKPISLPVYEYKPFAYKSLLSLVAKKVDI